MSAHNAVLYFYDGITIIYTSTARGLEEDDTANKKMDQYKDVLSRAEVARSLFICTTVG